jgi:hypothetical protein
MTVCIKCSKSIRPASLAANVDGESYHPTCISCAICDAPLWGKPFQLKDKKLVCERSCGGGSGLMPLENVPTKYFPNLNPIMPVKKNVIEDLISEVSSVNVSLKRRPSSAAQRQQNEIILVQQKLLQESQNSQTTSSNERTQTPIKIVPPRENSTLEQKPQIFTNISNKSELPTQQQENQNQKRVSFGNLPEKHVRLEQEKSSNNIQNNAQSENTVTGKAKQLSGTGISSAYIDPPHQEHKKCTNCNEYILFKKRYIIDEKGNVICQKCVDKKDAKQDPSREYSQNEKEVNDKTFVLTCSACGNTIHDSKYKRNHLGDISCENCELHGVRCFKCNLLFKLNEVATNHAKVNGGKPYHEHCFTCWLCNKRIQTTNFNLSESNQPMCIPCFEKSKLAKCYVCRRPITGEYVVFENMHLHRDCFRCSLCSKVINSESSYYRNKANNNLPICAKCNTTK